MSNLFCSHFLIWLGFLLLFEFIYYSSFSLIFRCLRTVICSFLLSLCGCTFGIEKAGRRRSLDGRNIYGLIYDGYRRALGVKRYVQNPELNFFYGRKGITEFERGHAHRFYILVLLYFFLSLFLFLLYYL